MLLSAVLVRLSRPPFSLGIRGPAARCVRSTTAQPGSAFTLYTHKATRTRVLPEYFHLNQRRQRHDNRCTPRAYSPMPPRVCRLGCAASGVPPRVYRLGCTAYRGTPCRRLQVARSLRDGRRRPACSECPLGSAARLLCLLGARLAALGSSGALASRLHAVDQHGQSGP